MSHWNVPLAVVSTIKQLVTPILKERILTIGFKDWIKVLSQNKILETNENRFLLESIVNRIQDNQKHYHIMNLESLFEEDNSGTTLQERMEKVYRNYNFEDYLELYDTDINKLKHLFLEMIRHVSVLQTNNYIVLKYGSEVTYSKLWNEFYMECRGVVIDIDAVALVVSPYRKFFNFNENDLTSFERIKNLLIKAKKVVIKNKEDGSMVSVAKYENELIVSTSGSLESVQSKWAKNFLLKHYPSFVQEMPDEVTFIFEAIYPDNRIVVDYKGEEKMVLTNMRSTIDGTYFIDSVVQLYSKMYDFPIPSYEKKSLTQILEDSQNAKIYPANEKEGWVFFIKTEDEELFFKVKCKDYCEIHQIIAGSNSPKIVWEHIKNDTFDDFVSRVPSEHHFIVYEIAKVIGERVDCLQQDLHKYLQLLNEDMIFTELEIQKSDKVKKVIKEEIAPLIDNRLAKTKRREIEEALLSKVFGKEPFIDKYVQKEFERLWSLIPSDLQEQKEFKKKEGRLLQFVYKNIPSNYQSSAFNYARGCEVDILSLIDIKEVVFPFLTPNKEKLEVL